MVWSAPLPLSLSLSGLRGVAAAAAAGDRPRWSGLGNNNARQPQDGGPQLAQELGLDPVGHRRAAGRAEGARQRVRRAGRRGGVSVLAPHAGQGVPGQGRHLVPPAALLQALGQEVREAGQEQR